MVGEVKNIFREFTKTNTSYAHCPYVFEDIKLFTTTGWNTFLKSVTVRKDQVGNQAHVAKAFLLNHGDTV